MQSYTTLSTTFKIPTESFEEFKARGMAFSEGLVRLAALSANCKAAFMAVLTSDGAELFGSYGLLLAQGLPKIQAIPFWLIPSQPSVVTHAAILEPMALLIGKQSINNAIGISIIFPEGVTGVLWLLDAAQTSLINLELLNGFAEQLSLSLQQELQQHGFQNVHKIARERDFALSIAQSITIGISVLDQNGTVIYVNPAFTKQFGYELSDFKYLAKLEHIPPEDHHIVRQALSTRVQGQSTVYKCRMYKKDKSIVFVEATGHPRVDKNGKHIGSLATHRDITQGSTQELVALEATRAMNKRLNDKLVETKQLLDSQKNFALEIMETFQDGFALINQAGVFEYVNHAFALIHDLPAQELIGTKAQAFIHAEDLESFLTATSAVGIGRIADLKIRIKRNDGTTVHTKALVSLRLNSLGQIIGALVSAQDMTQKYLDQALLEATQVQILREREMAMTIVQTSQEGLLMLKGMMIEFVNPQLEVIFGATKEALLGRNILSFVHPDDQYLSINAIKDLDSGQLIHYQQRLIKANGEIRSIVFNAKPRVSANGTIFGAIGSVRDVTEEILSKAKVLELEHQLGAIEEKFEQGAGFYGRLETVGGAVGLMQMLAVSQVGGAINLDDSVLFFEHGRIVAVNHPKLKGSKAIKAMIQRRTGQFQFRPNVMPSIRDLNLDLTKLVLEHQTEKDKSEHQQLNPTLEVNVEHHITLPNGKAAKAFIEGTGGRDVYQINTENNLVVLRGNNMKIKVLNATLRDLVQCRIKK